RYQDFFDLELLAGNFLSKEDSAKHTVINRKVADLMGFKDRYGEVIGEKLSSGWKGDKTIVGVVENFHTYSLDEELTYTLLIYDPSVFYEVSFKTSSTSKSGIKAALDYFRATWEEIYPEYVTSFDFLDDQIRERYELEESISTLMRIFSLISIVIGCLGLYGLISFVALNRVKEIGVRKVLGASALNILGLFSKETISLMLIAFIVACPIAYFTLDNWLQSYSYRISIGLDFFVFAFLATLIIALVTISHRTITSALINPATTLKDE
ncbi:MAG: FtsX-like permease family protein, partial [Cyclobacteriaceae bacterium]|nr:FtsX-like permease family protein [Cyclobacteriaceae bacterium HetDA_MAG_MS6]